MELANLGFFEQLSHPQFWVAVVQIIIVDILLAGDNAVVIALACRNLPPHLQKKGIFWGVFGAIALRILLTAFAATLLTLPWLKIIGGVALLWIGIKLLLPEHDSEHEISGSTNLILKLIERWPILIVAGGGLLGWIAGDLIATDPASVPMMQHLPSWAHYAFAVAGALLVIAVA